LAAWAADLLLFLFRPPDKKRFDVQPGIFKKPADIFKEKNNPKCGGNNHLDQITAASGIDVKKM
jgi:hypothetical protein